MHDEVGRIVCDTTGAMVCQSDSNKKSKSIQFLRNHELRTDIVNTYGCGFGAKCNVKQSKRIGQRVVGILKIVN